MIKTRSPEDQERAHAILEDIESAVRHTLARCPMLQLVAYCTSPSHSVSCHVLTGAYLSD